MRARPSGSPTSQSTSPASLPVSSRFTPTSMTTAPSFTMSPVTKRGRPAATQRMSARRRVRGADRASACGTSSPWRAGRAGAGRAACRPGASGRPRPPRRPRARRRSDRGSRGSPPACTAPTRRLAGEELAEVRRDGGRRRPCRARWPRAASSSSSPLGSGSWSRMPWIGRIGVDAPRSWPSSSACVQPPRVEVVARGDADLVGAALLVAHVDLRGGIVADQDDGQRRAGRRRRRASAATPRFTSASTLAATGLAVEDQHRGPAQAGARRAGARWQAPAGLGIDADDDAVQRRRPLGRLEAHRHLGEEALQDRARGPRRSRRRSGPVMPRSVM